MVPRNPLFLKVDYFHEPLGLKTQTFNSMSQDAVFL
ncbi:hypothetical protein DFP82_10135 [Psychrobacter fozii]|uniref:Uncharacterized protein n=1 Tax=Psychrobacter fozii TaxID=198480 RepID=A0A2V4VZB6_9GAMM|nr:hypothetical protein DFP82_10135 [Psychrobacter fozii]